MNFMHSFLTLKVIFPRIILMNLIHVVIVMILIKLMKGICYTWKLYVIHGSYMLYMEGICCTWKVYVVHGRYMLYMEDICCTWKIYVVHGRYMLYMEGICCMLRVVRHIHTKML